jgi:hypothetical protein
MLPAASEEVLKLDEHGLYLVFPFYLAGSVEIVICLIVVLSFHGTILLQAGSQDLFVPIRIANLRVLEIVAGSLQKSQSAETANQIMPVFVPQQL